MISEPDIVVVMFTLFKVALASLVVAFSLALLMLFVSPYLTIGSLSVVSLFLMSPRLSLSRRW